MFAAEHVFDWVSTPCNWTSFPNRLISGVLSSHKHGRGGWATDTTITVGEGPSWALMQWRLRGSLRWRGRWFSLMSLNKGYKVVSIPLDVEHTLADILLGGISSTASAWSEVQNQGPIYTWIRIWKETIQHQRSLLKRMVLVSDSCMWTMAERKNCALWILTPEIVIKKKAPIQTLCGESCRGGSTNSPNKRE